MGMDHWDDVRYFLAVEREGSLLGAGRALGVNAATVGRRVERLERTLGRKLFHRTNGGYALSQDGEGLLDHARSLEAIMFDIDRSGTGSESIGGNVAVTHTEALGEPFLIPLLADFQTLHPAIRIDLIRDDRSLSLTQREADIALRLVRPHQHGLKLRRLGALQFGLYATSGYLETRGVPADVTALGRHRIISTVDTFASLGPISWWAQVAPQAPVVRSNSPSERRAAAQSGSGIALLPRIMVRPEHGLCPVLGHLPIPPLDVWLVVHGDLARHPRVRAVLDFIADHAHLMAAGRSPQDPAPS